MSKNNLTTCLLNKKSKSKLNVEKNNWNSNILNFKNLSINNLNYQSNFMVPKIHTHQNILIFHKESWLTIKFTQPWLQISWWKFTRHLYTPWLMKINLLWMSIGKMDSRKKYLPTLRKPKRIILYQSFKIKIFLKICLNHVRFSTQFV